jgi:hypothetical protein
VQNEVQYTELLVYYIVFCVNCSQVSVSNIHTLGFTRG